MSSVPRVQLIEAVEDAIISSGYSGVRVSDNNEEPARFIVTGPSRRSISIWVYVRNLTPAGRSDADEYRIQLRSDILPLALNADGPTVLLGYQATLKLFAGFEPCSISTGATTQLSGGYISLRIVKRAQKQGMTFDRDRRDRIAVGVSPDMLVAYCLHASDIHAAAEDDKIVGILNSATSAFDGHDETGSSDNLESVKTERQRLIRSVSYIARDAGFRKRVLKAYQRRCAISGMQLELVEAAHILPVFVNGSTDNVTNGLSLLPQFHRAYDSGLIYLDTDFVMKVNDIRARHLTSKHLAKGLTGLSQSLGRIRLPTNRRDWPDLGLITQANAIRRITQSA